MAACLGGCVLVGAGFVYYKRVFGFGGKGRSSGHGEAPPIGDAADSLLPACEAQVKSMSSGHQVGEQEGDDALQESLFLHPAMLMGLYSGLLFLVDGAIAICSPFRSSRWKAAFSCGGAALHAFEGVALLLVFCFSDPARSAFDAARIRAASLNRFFFCFLAAEEATLESSSESESDNSAE